MITALYSIGRVESHAPHAIGIHMSSTVPMVQLCELLKCAMSKWDKNPDTLHISMGHSVGLKAARASEEELLND